MKFYQVYNLCIASELELPELLETNSEADVIIRFGTVDITSKDKYDGGKNIVGKIPEVGEFFIQGGREIIIEPLPNVDESLLRTVVLGPVLCVLLGQRGLLVLHASCININNKAVAFMGGSGWGKSTLAAAFHHHGYDVLTDDVMPIKITENKALVFPAYPQMKVSPEALISLGKNTKSLSKVYENSRKLSYKFPNGFQQNPLPLQQIYVLGKGSKHEITPIQPQNTFLELVRHTRTINSLTEKQFVSNHLHLCTQLIKIVSFSRFTRKPSLADLPKLVKLVESDIVQISDSNSLLSVS
ncbi:MAG: hypothetical protein QNJ47_19020 [Nostocaceae cyanobacterium]|nr:hypothetical protein [Nostocaceae cyanobacterium]